MELKLFKQKTSNLFGENRLLKFGFVALVVIVAFNSIRLDAALQNQRTHVVPAGAADGDMWISGRNASDTYFWSMAKAITTRLATYTAGTAEQQFDWILSLYAPEKLGAGQKMFDQLLASIEEHPRVASAYHWSGRDPLKIDREKGRLVVHGRKARYIAGERKRNPEKTYVIDFRIRQGRFEILAIKEREQ